MRETISRVKSSSVAFFFLLIKFRTRFTFESNEYKTSIIVSLFDARIFVYFLWRINGQFTNKYIMKDNIHNCTFNSIYIYISTFARYQIIL